jgi:iron complex outermembrane recepter protein
VHAGRLFANDQNTRVADGFDVLNLRASYGFRAGGLRWQALARLDNVADHRYVGSVIVGNANPYEPAPGRNWLLGLRLVVPL